MDYRERYYYLICVDKGFIDEFISLVKTTIRTAKIRVYENINIPEGYCKIMISCKLNDFDNMEQLFGIISFLIKNNYLRIMRLWRPLNDIQIIRLTKETLGQ